MAKDIKNMNMSIVVDDGSRRVPIQNTNGEEVGEFTFHPTDLGIVQRYNQMAGSFDDITAPLAGITPNDAGEIDIFDPKNIEALTEAEKRLREAVNRLFGSDDAAEAFFGKMHPFSPINGDFYCAQVLQRVGEFISAQFDTETKAMSKKVRKYLK